MSTGGNYDRKKVSCAPDMFHHLAAFTVAFFISLSPLDPTFGQLIPTISRLNVKRAIVVRYDMIITENEDVSPFLITTCSSLQNFAV